MWKDLRSYFPRASNAPCCPAVLQGICGLYSQYVRVSDSVRTKKDARKWKRREERSVTVRCV